jgi:hypothetical protein
MFDMNIISDFPESNTIVSAGSKQACRISMAILEEGKQHPALSDVPKDELSVGSMSKLSEEEEEEEEEEHGGIMRRTSFTIESTRAESIKYIKTML